MGLAHLFLTRQKSETNLEFVAQVWTEPPPLNPWFSNPHLPNPGVPDPFIGQSRLCVGIRRTPVLTGGPDQSSYPWLSRMGRRWPRTMCGMKSTFARRAQEMQRAAPMWWSSAESSAEGSNRRRRGWRIQDAAWSSAKAQSRRQGRGPGPQGHLQGRQGCRTWLCASAGNPNAPRWIPLSDAIQGMRCYVWVNAQ
jgi:hypothetical protein